MLKTIYFTGFLAGILFPLIDDFLHRYSKLYREVGSDHSRSFTEIYRQGPFSYKLIAALIPVLNLIWVFGILLIIRMYILYLFENISIWIIRKLARNPHRHFIIKVKIVKSCFKSYLNDFYRLCEHAIEIREKNNKTILRLLKMIDKVAAAETEKKQEDEQQGTSKGKS